MVWDDFQVRCIAELEFRSRVKGVRLRRDRIVAVLENKVYIYNFADLNLMDQIDTYTNPSGLCAVNATKDDMVMACLGEGVGEVRLDVYAKNQTRIIVAHTTAIQQMCLNLSGSRLATSSERGTLFRVFDTDTGKQLFEFRRGAAPAVIQSIAFNKEGTALVASSDHGTVHVYSCVDAAENQKSSLSFMSSMLPYLGSTWSSKQFSVPESRSVVAFGNEEKGKQYIILLGASGKYYRYSYTNEKSECHQEGVKKFLQA
eukprot:TRINITY_DN1027_c0_g1_i2.p1 TRINITY_DN1027_c0_g1~~TRINITY_DN1027_c0_g1_i2.p1  ORF type:complete len:258 (-),score=43.40 TRINITY_DN1027_c0_g1_i2:113-886(-)